MRTAGAVEGIVSEFVDRLTSVIEDAARTRVREVMLSAMGGSNGLAPKRGPGRPPGRKVAVSPPASPPASPMRLCPVPGCKNTAAPVFGMVCAQHKDLPKSVIKMYRAERKAKALARVAD